MFYEVRRYSLDADAVAADDTAGRFHVLNVVEGEGIVVRTAAGDRHPLSYAETLTVPAAVGGYRLEARSGPAKVVKALVRDRRAAGFGPS
jgi:mannose-6-phosphate isomerase class I